jgi:hypothetical protein
VIVHLGFEQENSGLGISLLEKDKQIEPNQVKSIITSFHMLDGRQIFGWAFHPARKFGQ